MNVTDKLETWWQSCLFFLQLDACRIELQFFCCFTCLAPFILICGLSRHVFSFRLLLDVSILKAYQQSSGTSTDPWLGARHSGVSVCSWVAPLKSILKIKKSFMKLKYWLMVQWFLHRKMSTEALWSFKLVLWFFVRRNVNKWRNAQKPTKCPEELFGRKMDDGRWLLEVSSRLN